MSQFLECKKKKKEKISTCTFASSLVSSYFEGIEGVMFIVDDLIS